jgi:outer membrane protein assembly factor BamD (BamD/ComL family)
MTAKNILKQILMILLAAALVFLMFYNCTGNKNEEQKAEVKKDTLNKTNSVYTNDCRSLYIEARKNDSIILLATEIDPKVGSSAIKAFTDFSFYCANDSLAPMFLLKAGQIAEAINNLPQAQLSFEKVIKDFPKYRNRGAAMFLLAHMYDEPALLNDEDKAKQLYIEIINSYPGSDWSNNARAAMDLLGKTDEQIVREFEKKNQKK